MVGPKGVKAPIAKPNLIGKSDKVQDLEGLTKSITSTFFALDNEGPLPVATKILVAEK